MSGDPHDRTHRRERGFSLAEMTVALTIAAMLFVTALAMLALDHRLYATTDARDEAAREARLAVDLLERDLLMTGFRVDHTTVADPGPDGVSGTDDDLVGQPKIAYAAPWELVVNADLDPSVDAIAHGKAADSLPSGYAPVTFHTGAETIRYTLDSNGDGTVDGADHGDEPEEHLGPNPGLFLLRREVYGDNGTDNVNPSGPVALVRGPIAYPNGVSPQPLFLYWGEFDQDPELDLWGDDGSGGGIAGNGLLEPGELAALGPVTGEDADGDATLDPGEDRNGDGRLERRPDELIRRVEVHVTAETPQPDLRYTDPVRSGANAPFRYRTVTLSTIIEPRNIRLPGGACGDVPEPAAALTVENACPNPLSDGRLTLSWQLSADDGGGENDVQKYLVYRTESDSLFGPSPFAETAAGASSWQDDQVDVTAWPPRQYWYRVRAMDCTPQLSQNDPVAGPYPAELGPAPPFSIEALDVPGDAGDAVELRFPASIDDPANSSGYGGAVTEYRVYRSTGADVRCVVPIDNDPLAATGASHYTYRDDGWHSATAPVLGTLYHYWVRARDGAGRLSNYSASACVRPSRGPARPEAPRIRVASWAPDDHPVEIWFRTNSRNEAAGYDPARMQYNVYRSTDINGDGVADSFVDYSPGYTANQRVATVSWTGLVWAAGDLDNDAIHHSIDGGQSWRSASPGPGGRPLEIEFADRLVGVTVGAGGAIRRSDDGGVSWAAVSSPVAVDLADVAWLDGARLVACGASGTLLRSLDAGQSWQTRPSGTAADLDAVTAQGDLVIAAGAGGAVLRSADGGESFAPVTVTSEDLHSACSAAEPNGVTVMLGGRDRIWRSTDGGLTWSPVALPGSGKILALDCVPGGAAVAATESRQILLSSDGLAFTPSSETGAARPTDAGLLAGGQVFVSDNGGRVHYRGPDGVWRPPAQLTGGSSLTGIAVRPEIAWEDASTATAPSGATHFYVVTAAYAAGDPALDGESGLLPDRPAAEESPDDGLDQILVDSCNDFELSVVTP